MAEKIEIMPRSTMLYCEILCTNKGLVPYGEYILNHS